MNTIAKFRKMYGIYYEFINIHMEQQINIYKIQSICYPREQRFLVEQVDDHPPQNEPS